MANDECGYGDRMFPTLEAFLASTPQAVYAKDGALRYIGASKTFADLLGFSNPDALIGHTDFDFMPEAIAERCASEDRRVLASGKPSEAVATPLSSKISGLCCAKIERAPLNSSDGSVAGVYGIIRDLIDARKARADYDRVLARLFDLAPDTHAALLFDVDRWSLADARISPMGKGVVPESGSVFDYQRNCLEHILEADDVRALVAALSPESIRDLYRDEQGDLLYEYVRAMPDGSRRKMRDEARIFTHPENGHLMAAVIVRDLGMPALRSASLAGEAPLPAYEELRTAQMLIGKLAAEFEFVALMDAKTGMLKVLSNKSSKLPELPGVKLSYPDFYADYFRDLVIRSETEDCVARMSLHSIKTALACDSKYELSYSIYQGDEIRRKKWRFTYLSNARDTIVYLRSDDNDAYMMQFNPITGLYNRYTFYREARRMIDRNPNEDFVIACFDMDNFHIFNDLYGIEAGNHLLSSIKELLRTIGSEKTIYGHIEADHFACIMSRDEFDLAPEVARINAWLRQNCPDFDFSPKIGVYFVDDPSLDIVVMCDRALMALNSIKKIYGVHLAHYCESMRIKLLNEQSIVNDMGSALKNGEFGVYFQPQYDFLSGKMTGAEALLRWFHPKKGILTPGAFLSIFESNGFITQIDKRVWELVCARLHRWIKMGLDVMPISVNVSRMDIYDPEICMTLKRLIDKYDLYPTLLRLEITETVYMKDPKQLIETVSKLRSMGFIVEMDDFGSAYSSLNMLKDVPVDVLKLDMAFLNNSSGGARGDGILRAVVDMAHKLSVPLVAEGVETEAQANYLASIGCKYMQGYYFSRPMPADEFEKRLVDATDC